MKFETPKSIFGIFRAQAAQLKCYGQKFPKKLTLVNIIISEIKAFFMIITFCDCHHRGRRRRCRCWPLDNIY